MEQTLNIMFLKCGPLDLGGITSRFTPKSHRYLQHGQQREAYNRTTDSENRHKIMGSVQMHQVHPLIFGPAYNIHIDGSEKLNLSWFILCQICIILQIVSRISPVVKCNWHYIVLLALWVLMQMPRLPSYSPFFLLLQ